MKKNKKEIIVTGSAGFIGYSLSIKLLEEIEKKEALEKYGAEGSGKNLPFSSLSEDLKKKDKDKD